MVILVNEILFDKKNVEYLLRTVLLTPKSVINFAFVSTKLSGVSQFQEQN